MDYHVLVALQPFYTLSIYLYPNSAVNLSELFLSFYDAVYLLMFSNKASEAVTEKHNVHKSGPKLKGLHLYSAFSDHHQQAGRVKFLTQGHKTKSGREGGLNWQTTGLRTTT